MSTHIHVSGLSFFCTDDKLREAFVPFGTVVLAQVVRDEQGHSLGVGIVHMASCEDVERIFNAHQRFEIAGSRVDLWEAAESEPRRCQRIVVYDLPRTANGQTVQDTGQGKSQKALQPLAALMHRLIHTLVPSTNTIGH